MQKPRVVQALAVGLVATVLCSCVGTSLKQTWKSPDSQTDPVGKVAAVAVDERDAVRRGFENRFVSQLGKHGTSAFATADMVSLAEIKADRAGAATRLRAAGADTVLVIRLVDSSLSYAETRLGADRPGPASSDPWSDYYHADIGSTYGTLKQTARLETSLFDLNTSKRIWSGLTETVTTETMDRVAQMDKVVGKVVAAMRKDGMIR